MTFNIFEVLCSDWFIYNIQEHLVPKDFFVLKYVCKYYYKYITKNDIKKKIISTIHERLKKVLNIQYETFIKYISKNYISISGSFIIQCILGEYYEESDIDMYSYLIMEEHMFFDIFSMESLTEMQKQMFADYGCLPDIASIINEKLENGHKLQQIVMNSTKIKTLEQLKNFVLSSFDFNICKNLFSIIDGKEYLYIHSLWNIINKHDIITTVKFDRQVPNRIEKYKKRGFNFNFDINATNYIGPRGLIL